jgi:hypothetical protein
MSGTRVRAGLSTITANMGNNNYLPPQGYKVGKVYAVILSDKSVPQNIWEANGEWAGIGTILYQEYSEGAEISIENITDNLLSGFPTALPLYPNQKYFPLPGEIVLLMDLPSAPSPITGKTEETYYLTTINAWNSPQFNGLFVNEQNSLLYDSFNEDQDFRGLQTFEGDYILEGRFGNSIRFGSTNKSGDQDLSPWSTNPGELSNNPITLITNKHNFKLPNSDLYIEDINKDGSSVYLTSNQSIPLNIGNVKLSNITSPIAPFFYFDPQVIINADRTVISSKKDEVLIFGKKGVEIYSQGTIYFQSDEVGITLQDNAIFLGPYNNNGIVPQPLLLGNDVKIFLANLIKSISDFCSSTAGMIVTPEGTTMISYTDGITAFQANMKSYIDELKKLDSLVSKITHTI